MTDDRERSGGDGGAGDPSLPRTPEEERAEIDDVIATPALQ